jgi:hypothetical protein
MRQRGGHADGEDQRLGTIREKQPDQCHDRESEDHAVQSAPAGHFLAIEAEENGEPEQQGVYFISLRS